MTNMPPESSDATPRDDVPTDPVSNTSASRLPDDYYVGMFDSEAGVQATGEISDGDTYVTDEDLRESTADGDDPAVARELAAEGLEGPDVEVPTEEQVLTDTGTSTPTPSTDGEDDDGEDPVPVPA